MASALYDKLVKTIAVYIGEEKASGAVGRQLKHCGATCDELSQTHLKAILTFVTAATTLYVSDPAKKAELVAEITALC